MFIYSNTTIIIQIHKEEMTGKDPIVCFEKQRFAVIFKIVVHY